MASIAITNESRLAGGVIAMAAAEPARILASCDGRRGRFRERVLQRLDWDRDRYRRAVARHFHSLDVATESPWADPGNLLMFDARFDGCMPRETRDELWRRLGRPERITILGGHRSAFLAMTVLGLNSMSRATRRFLDESL